MRSFFYLLLLGVFLGTAALVQVPDRDLARAVLTPDRYSTIEVHRWDYGGRPDQ